MIEIERVIKEELPMPDEMTLVYNYGVDLLAQVAGRGRIKVNATDYYLISAYHDIDTNMFGDRICRTIIQLRRCNNVS